MNRSALTLGLCFLALSIATFVLYAQRFDSERSGGESVAILVAKKALPRGKTISDDMLTVRSVPLAYVEDRSVKLAEREKVVGLRIVHALDANDAVMWSDFIDPLADNRDLSSLVTPGYRAVYVKAMQRDQGAALIRPGDFVDVIVTMPLSSEGRDGKSSFVLLQKALVLANGMRTTAAAPLPDPDDRRAQRVLQQDQGLTLSLSLAQAQSVAAAATRGRFSVALRNPDDERTYTSVPSIGPAALVDPKARAAIELGTYDPATIAGGAPDRAANPPE